MDNRARINAIDDTILTPIVRLSQNAQTLELQDWAIEELHNSLGEGLGINRFSGQALDQGVTKAWSLILKVVGRSQSNQDKSSWDYWWREADVYQSGFLDQLPSGLSAPRCFGVHEPNDGIAWLWLEDVGNAKDLSWELADHRQVARQLGQMNGYFLNQELREPWMSQHWLRSRIESHTAGISLLGQSLEDPWVRRMFPPAVAKGIMQLWDERERFLRALERVPQTFCHLDVFRRNLSARLNAQGARETLVFDWAFAGIGALGQELAPLVMANLSFFEVDWLEGRALEEQTFEGYLQGLHDSGWQGDPALVRLGYTCAGPLFYGLSVLEQILYSVLNEAMHPIIEQIFGRPMHQVSESVAFMHARYTLRLADEARVLMDKLGFD
jgi:Phosphotransferase enzyme family